MQKLIRRILRRSSDRIIFPSKNIPVHEETSLESGRSSLPKESFSVKISDQPNMENSLYSWLHTVAPAFPVNADKIRILKEPSEFYKILLEKCNSAQHRIVLSSLYLGTGQLEKALVESIRQRVRDQQGELKVTFLLDHCRGSRGAMNSRSMVAPLLNEQPESVQVSLYHSVALRGFLRWILPQRFNEIIGLQHMKLYIFDDSVVISGANLSHDYFTNRQDRYFVVDDCIDLANFYANLVHRVCEFSFQLLPNGSTSLHSSWLPENHPFEGNRDKFTKEAHKRVWEAFSSPIFKSTRLLQSTTDTWIFPLLQMGQLKIHQDSEVTLRLLEDSPAGSHIHLATGYFNLTNQYVEKILCKSKAAYTILTAHPTANGFLNARGLAGGIPALYTQLAKEFFLLSSKLGQQDRVLIQEYIRSGWTYHGKGLWLTLPDQHLPSLTLIGSPNFGSRSVERDLETQLAIITSNQCLQRSLADERDRLYEKGQVVTKVTFSQDDRSVPLWVLCISRLFRRLF